MKPILRLMKTDLARPNELLGAYHPSGVTMIAVSADNLDSVDESHRELEGRFLILVGRSGVGESAPINVLAPGMGRAVGHVNEVTGQGRYTSISSKAFEPMGGGWIVGTPGVRSLGVGHVSVEDILSIFPKVGEATGYCLLLCSCPREELSYAIDTWAKGHSPSEPVEEEVSVKRKGIAESTRRLLASVTTAEAVSKATC